MIVVSGTKDVLRHAKNTVFQWHICHKSVVAVCQPNLSGFLYLSVRDVTPWFGDATCMPVEDMRTLLSFLHRIPKEDNVLINCARGRGRAPATAIILKYLWCGRAGLAAEWLFKTYTKSTPNGWMLKLADCLLETNLFDEAQLMGFVRWRYPKPGIGPEI